MKFSLKTRSLFRGATTKLLLGTLPYGLSAQPGLQRSEAQSAEAVKIEKMSSLSKPFSKSAGKRRRLFEEGRFSTRDILFDTGSAGIRPESAGVLESVAAVLTRNSDMKVLILVQPDPPGDRQTVLRLSEERAEAIKAVLTVVYRVAASRIEVAGNVENVRLSHRPALTDNDLNRRVEFIKL